MRAPFAREVLAQVAGDGKPVVLILDQSKVSDRHQGRMLALRYGERAVPLAWRVETTAGAIGFDTQKALLEAVAPWVPAEAKVTLMGDRFYGTADVSGGCQQRDWGYRLRLKGNLVVFEGTDKTTTGACASRGLRGHGQDHDRRLRQRKALLSASLSASCKLSNAPERTGKRARPNIGIIHDPGHAEPWIIAMSERPSYVRSLAYGQRWGSAPMVSDFQSRGFGVEDTQIRDADRVDRLILVSSLALSWAVSTGLWDALHHATPSEKSLASPPKKAARSRTSWFTRGLRRIVKRIRSCLPLPPLWGVLLN